MKKGVIFLVMVLLLVQTVLAFKTLEIESFPQENVLIGSKEATFWVTVYNNGNSKDTFRASTLNIGWDLEPQEVTVYGNSKETFIFTISPQEEREAATYGISVKFTSQKDNSIKDAHLFTIDVLDYEDLIRPAMLLPKQINPNEESLISVDLFNEHNIKLKEVRVVLESDYFSYEKVMDFEAYEEKKEDFFVSFEGSLEEGKYPVYVRIHYKDQLAREDSVDMNIGYFTEVSEVKAPESGFLVERNTIVKTNDGNVVSHERYEKEVNWLQKFFTSSDPEPTSVIKDGDHILVWEFDLQSGEEKTIFIETNYRYLVLAIIVIVLILVWLYNLTKRELVISKKLTTIKRSREGYSTLNIQIIIKNKSKHILHDVKILDKLSGISEEPSFGIVKPDTVKRIGGNIRMMWNIPTIHRGEERVISYQARIRLRIIGKMIIPVAVAKYRLREKVKYVRSNAIRLFS